MVILPLDSEEATLPLVGGKGVNLARLAQAELAVPGGFLITTAAYRAYVAANGLTTTIVEALQASPANDVAALQTASQTIRDAFTAGAIPPDLQTDIVTAYHQLAGEARETAVTQPAFVAVRSSATAEDLPDMSFAGQQDTFLHVQGETALLTAVVACWSSLWTARAIGYRARNGIAQNDVALAVVVQVMVPSEASGVLFTVNPLNGRRTETVIDATLGLGEALVSGQVEPDHYVVAPMNQQSDLALRQTTGFAITQKSLGAKALAIHGQASGGTVTVTEDAATRQAIPDEVILELAALGERVAALFGSPQDIEWGWAAGKLWLLQSRPITSLFPLPTEERPLAANEPLRVWFSFAAVQGLMDPITPLGQDMLKLIFAGGAGLFGVKRTLATQSVVWSAGERLWLDIHVLLRHPIGRKLVMAALPMVEPGTAQALATLLDEPRLQTSPRWFKWTTFWRIGRMFVPLLRSVIRVARHPARERAQRQHAIDEFVASTAVAIQSTPTLVERVALFEKIALNGFVVVLPPLLPVVVVGMASLNLLSKLAKSVGQDALLLTRGLPHNVTTEMDLALWHTAQAIRQDDAARMQFEALTAAGLADLYVRGGLATGGQTAVAQFLAQYGMRGLGEIDFGRKRWREDPTPVMQTLQSYLHIQDGAMAPDVMFERGLQEAETAVGLLGNALRKKGPKGWLQAKIAHIAFQRMRAAVGLRETPKFTIIRVMGLLRTALLDSGANLVERGILDAPEDLFYLSVAELKRVAVGETRLSPPSDGSHQELQEKIAVKALVAERRVMYERQKRRRQIPRLMVSDGRSFYEGVAATGGDGDDVLSGSPVSPGVVEGRVRVVFDPYETQLRPGEILVCPGTDPSWTPLFLAAGGLVMEVGGLMTHGSVVAREYGIPAVVGVNQATSRLETGQWVRVDGSSGKIEILHEG